MRIRLLISITDKFESIIRNNIFFSTCKNYTTHRENEILDGEWPRLLEILAPTGLARELLYIVRASLSFIIQDILTYLSSCSTDLTTMLLARCSGCSSQRAGPSSRSGFRPRPTPICCPYPATRPHHSTVESPLPVCANENLELVGGESRKSLRKACVPPKSQQYDEKASVHLLNCRCDCSTKLSASVVGRITALRRALVPAGRS